MQEESDEMPGVYGAYRELWWAQMMPCHTHNHPYAMITNNMIVRRLLSLPHWEPSVRKQTKGGRLLILRGVQFGPTLFPEIVIPRNHASPPVNPAM